MFHFHSKSFEPGKSKEIPTQMIFAGQRQNLWANNPCNPETALTQTIYQDSMPLTKKKKTTDLPLKPLSFDQMYPNVSKSLKYPQNALNKLSQKNYNNTKKDGLLPKFSYQLWLTLAFQKDQERLSHWPHWPFDPLISKAHGGAWSKDLICWEAILPTVTEAPGLLARRHRRGFRVMLVDTPSLNFDLLQEIYVPQHYLWS